MQTIALLVIAVTLAGCASTRQERAAAFQQELPQLVAACNGWAQADPRIDGPTSGREAFKACDRLSVRKSLTLTDPATVSAYHRAKSGALRSPPTWGVVSVPAPLPQNQ
jgi:hypothetical protein